MHAVPSVPGKGARAGLRPQSLMDCARRLPCGGSVLAAIPELTHSTLNSLVAYALF